MSKSLALTAVVLSTLAGAASAQVVVAGFAFNTPPVNGNFAEPTYAAEYGVGAYSTNFEYGDVVLFSGSTLGEIPGNGGTYSVAFRNGENGENSGRYAQFAFDSTGYADLTLTFAAHRTNAGFTALDIQVSDDGVDFTTVETVTGVSSTYGLFTVDLTAQDLLEDAASAVIRVVFRDPAVPNSIAGYTRLDNVVISGTAIPAPATVPVALLGLGACAARRRRA